MKSILLSIHPKYCELIVSGKKIMELRKTKPKIEPPFKVHMYMTKSKWYKDYKNEWHYGLGKVVGEFVCNSIEDFSKFPYKYDALLRQIKLQACVNYDEAIKYLEQIKKGYGWHISDCKLYSLPKELSKFKKINRDCWYADLGLAKRDCPECRNVECFLTRPPQSWCYVEETRGD